VDEINRTLLDQLPGNVVQFKSFDVTKEINEAVNFPVEFLNSQNPSGLPQHDLKLKVQAPIILLRNLDAPRLCNGTRLCVTALKRNLIEARILTGCAKNTVVLIPRIPIIADDIPFPFKRTQFPVRLAFSMSINKSQGQSMTVMGCDLVTPCFSHGQLYVACSRVGSRSNSYCHAPTGFTKNVVYTQVLDN
jgi:ATP-dependent DNA helicase PIF1